MINLPLAAQLSHVLCLGAHCDDVEIGCGGVLMSLARARPEIRFTVVVFASDGKRAAETKAAMQQIFPAGAQLDLRLHQFRDGFFPADWAEVKRQFESIKQVCNPDLVLTHYERDKHQDHRVLSELTWNTFRTHVILEYEIPKYDGDFGQPNLYAPLTADVVEHKVQMLLESFPSQAGRNWFTADLFKAQMRLRGMECNAESGYAEAFYARKLRLQC